MLDIDERAVVGAAVAFRALEKDARKEVAAATRSKLKPLWTKIVATRVRNAQRSVSGAMDSRMAGKGRASVSAGGKGTLAGYTTGRSLSGGMTPGSDWPWVEFGTNRSGYAGTRLPRFTPGGRIVYPGFKSWAPTATSVWLGVLYDAIRSTGVTQDA